MTSPDEKGFRLQYHHRRCISWDQEKIFLKFDNSNHSYYLLCNLQLSTTKKEIKMKISVDKNVVEITPETEEETASLDTLWKVVIDCYGNNKKIVPIGQFVPGFDKLARFHIEG